MAPTTCRSYATKEHLDFNARAQVYQIGQAAQERLWLGLIRRRRILRRAGYELPFLGYFGGAVNVTDGRYTYHRYPADLADAGRFFNTR